MYRDVNLVLGWFVVVMAGVSLASAVFQWRKAPRNTPRWFLWSIALAAGLLLVGIVMVFDAITERDVTLLQFGPMALTLVASVMVFRERLRAK